MTINNKSERNYRGKCLGWPVTSYGGAFIRCRRNFYGDVFIVFFGAEPDRRES